METLTTFRSSKCKLKSLFSLTSLSPAAADIRKCDAFVSVMQNCTNAQMHPPPTNTQHLSFLKAGASASSLNQKKTVKSLLHGIHLGHSYIGLLNSENNLKIGFIFVHNMRYKCDSTGHSNFSGLDKSEKVKNVGIGQA